MDIVGIIVIILVIVGLAIIGFSLLLFGKKTSNKQSQIHNNIIDQYYSNPITREILSIRDEYEFFPGDKKTKIYSIFKSKNIYPIYDNWELTAYLIPDVKYIIDNKIISITGDGDRQLWWLFQYDRSGQLIQHGLLTDSQMENIGKQNNNGY